MKFIKFIYIYLIIIIIYLSGCSSSKKVANVEHVTSRLVVVRGIHVVDHGESLYSIAFGYGRDFRELAAINNIRKPYKIRPGQKISLNKTTYKPLINKTKVIKKAVITKKVVKKPVHKTKKVINNQSVKLERWQWPLNGKVVNKFNSKQKLNNGIDIAVKTTNRVKAAQPGKVVYRGAGLKGYGKLIIIKHSEEYLSAYAYNDLLLVKEGQWVKQGQAIATIGKQNKKLLHFEIRKKGKPVDPMIYLSK